jgi:cyclopropane-fatty-acyl-phospholipid synthase
MVGANRARIWRLYMAASVINFKANRASIHQVLAVNTPDSGNSKMPPTRKSYTNVNEQLAAS